MEPLTMLIIAAYGAYQTFKKEDKKEFKVDEDYMKSFIKKRRCLNNSDSTTNNKCCEKEEERPLKRNKICEK